MLHSLPPFEKARVRQVVLDKWFPLTSLRTCARSGALNRACGADDAVGRVPTGSEGVAASGASAERPCDSQPPGNIV